MSISILVERLRPEIRTQQVIQRKQAAFLPDWRIFDFEPKILVHVLRQFFWILNRKLKVTYHKLLPLVMRNLTL